MKHGRRKGGFQAFREIFGSVGLLAFGGSILYDDGHHYLVIDQFNLTSSVTRISSHSRRILIMKQSSRSWSANRAGRLCYVVPTPRTLILAPIHFAWTLLMHYEIQIHRGRFSLPPESFQSLPFRDFVAAAVSGASVTSHFASHP